MLAWREELIANRIGEWTGPFTVTATHRDKRIIDVTSDRAIGPPKAFSLSQVKAYRGRDEFSEEFFINLYWSLSAYKTPSDEPEDHRVLLTEVLDTNDPRCTTKEIVDAICVEVKGLLQQGKIKIILRRKIPPDGDFMPGKLILAIKSAEDGEVKFKARYVIGGHGDRQDVWISDVTQAYLQSAAPHMREMYIANPTPEFELSENQCFKLLKLLYGLCGAGDLWWETLDRYHREDLNMRPFRSDPAFHRLLGDKTLHGISGIYSDDMLRAGDQHFKHIAKLTWEKFNMGENESAPFTFTVFHVLHSDGDTSELEMEQYRYIDSMTVLSPTSRR